MAKNFARIIIQKRMDEPGFLKVCEVYTDFDEAYEKTDELNQNAKEAGDPYYYDVITRELK